MEQIRVDMTPKGIKPVCHSSQYDKGRIIRLNLVDGIQGYTLTGEETLELEVRKPDNNIVTAEVQNTSSNYVLIVTTEQMTACEGDSNCEIRVRLGDTDIGSINFILRVEEDPLKDGIESETVIHDLEHQVSELVSEQYDSENVIFDAEPTEDHGNGYTVTSEGIKSALDTISASIPTEINDLSDVNISSPTQGEALVFDADGNIVNGTVSTVGNLDDLSDVDTTGKQEGDSLRYDGAEWVAKPTTVEMTQAEYNAIVDFTPYANTHIVITDAPNLNPDASDIEYSSGVSVADKLDDLEDNKADSSDIPTVTDLSSSVTVGGAFNSPNYKKLYKYGNICHLVFRAQLNTQLNDNTSFLGIPSSCAPKGGDYAQIIWTGSQYATNTPKNAYYGSWDSSLHNLGSVSSGTYIAIDTVWITN